MILVMSLHNLNLTSRTFLESEVKNPVIRKDLYEKMIKLDPNEPTQEEHEQKGITKLRYMQVTIWIPSSSGVHYD